MYTSVKCTNNYKSVLFFISDEQQIFVLVFVFALHVMMNVSSTFFLSSSSSLEASRMPITSSSF